MVLTTWVLSRSHSVGFRALGAGLRKLGDDADAPSS